MNPHEITSELTQWLALGRPHVAPYMAPAQGPRTCPSYPEKGRAFAARLRSGELVFLDPADSCEARADTVSTRAHGPCVTSRCAYWSGNCQLGAMITAVAIRTSRTDPTATVRSCPISSSCRWLAENGSAACLGCIEADYFMSSN